MDESAKHNPEAFEQEPLNIEPQRKKTGLTGSASIMPALLWLTAVFLVGMLLGNLLWLAVADILALNRPKQMVEITITPEDTLSQIADKLNDGGLVDRPGLFRLFARITGAMEDIHPGTYSLSTSYDYPALVNSLRKKPDKPLTVQVTIPEGYTCSQIFNLLQKQQVCTAAQLEDAAVSGMLEDFWFLENINRDSPNALEGYLFPDTYTFYLNDDPVRVLNKLLSGFDNRFTDIMKEKLPILNQSLAVKIEANGLSPDDIAAYPITFDDVVIIASMIQKESANAQENYLVSSVIYNRLTNPSRFPYLNIDATLVYITGNLQLTEADKQIDNPYNTYRYPGLIPGPISNPGQSCLDAALDPEDTAFYFYALDPKTKVHSFSETYEEHLSFLESIKE